MTKLNLSGILELDVNMQGTTSASVPRPGVVQLDNTLPIATTSSLGVVQPDGSTVTVTTGGVISVNASAIGPTKTTNVNGTCISFGSTWVHQFGSAGPSITGVDRCTIVVTFPVPFSSIPHVVCNASNNPDGYGTAVFPCYPTNITTTGFLANLTCGVTIGGSGPSNIVYPTYVDWIADL